MTHDFAGTVRAGQTALDTASAHWRTVQGRTPLPLARPGSQNPDRVRRALATAVIGRITPRRAASPDARRERETIARVETDGTSLLGAYADRFGHILNADSMSELLDVHGRGRWEHHDAVRSSASALVQAAFEALMREPAQKDDVVVFMAGGNGSGKSTFASALADVWTVLDSTFSDAESSRRNVETALASGRRAVAICVYREPLDAFLHGVLPRALAPDNGRPVPVSTHAGTHRGAPATTLALAAHFAAEPRLTWHVVENATGQPSRLRDLAWLHEVWAKAPPAEDVRVSLDRALAAQVASGAVDADLAGRLGRH